MSDVFISYSRRDIEIVLKIAKSLTTRNREAWIDLQDIDYSSKWWDEICAGIDRADNFVLFVSPNSLQSLFCHREIQHALKHNKRIIPFLLNQVDPQAMFQTWQNSPDLSKYDQIAHENWDSLQAIQWIDYTKINDIDLAVDALLITVDTDPERVKRHTRLLLRLRDWESRGRDPSSLLRGDELTLYEAWFTESRQKKTAPHPTDAQEGYIAESRRVENEAEAKRIQRERLIRRFRVASVALGAFLGLAVIATILTIGVATRASDQAAVAISAQGQANTQVAMSGITLQAGSTLIADGSTQVARSGVTLQAGITLIAVATLAQGHAIDAQQTSVAKEGQAISAQQTSISREGQANTQVAMSGITLQAGNTLIAAGNTQAAMDKVTVQAGNTLVSVGNTQVAIVAQTLTPIPPKLTAVAQTIVAGNYMIESLNLAAAANTILQTDGGNAETAALLSIRVLRTNYVTSADAALVAATSRLKAVTRVFHYQVQGGGISTVVFSPDSKTFLIATSSGGDSGGAELHNTASGNVIWANNETSSVNDVVFSADGKLIVAAMGDYTAQLWDAASGQTIRVFQGHTAALMRATFSPDSKTILTFGSGNDLTLRLWNVATGKQLFAVPSSGGFGGLYFFPDGQTFGDGMYLYQASNGNRTGQIQGGTFVISPDGKTYVTGISPEAKRYDMSSDQLLNTFAGHTHDIRSAAFSSDGKWLVTGSQDNTARVWDIASGKLLMILSGHTDSVETVAFSPDGTLVITGSRDNTVRLWNISADNQQQIIAVPAGIQASALAPDGTAILVGDVNGNTNLWDLNSGQLVHSFPKGNSDVKAVAFSPDGKFVAIPNSSSIDKARFDLYDSLNGTPVKTFTVDSLQPYITALTFSPDSNLIFAAYMDGTARLWDIASGQVLRVFNSNDPVNHGPVTFSPDGKLMVLDGGRTWLNVADGGLINFPRIPTGPSPLGVVFSPDGSLFASPDEENNSGSSDSNAVAIWNVSTQQIIMRFTGHTNQITSMAISSDNKQLLTGSADKTARLWNIATGQSLRVFSGHSAAVTSVGFIPDSSRIVTGSRDMTIRTWIADYNDLLVYACTRVGRDFDAQERALYGIADQEPTCPQFAAGYQPPLAPTTMPMPTRTPLPTWTPIATPTPGNTEP